MTRFKAFSVHLSISAMIFFVLLGFILLRWYPQPYFAYDGGWRGIRIVFSIDIVLGPLLTLIVFKPGKRWLKFDLTVIALVQLAALTYGVTTVYQQRTALVVFFRGAFYTVAGSQIPITAPQGPRLVQASHTHPAYVAVHLPATRAKRYVIFTAVFHGAPPPYLRGDLYQKFRARDTLGSGINVTKLVKGRPADQRRLAAFLHGRPVSAFAFVPLDCRYRRLLLVIRRHDAKIVGPLEINPYPLFGFY
ncbi:MAG: hypothetical protein ACYCXT_03415 [Acidiferrobacteraceae bacterium]